MVEPPPNPVDEPPNPPKPPVVELVPPKRPAPLVVVVEPKPVLFWLKGDELEGPNPPAPNVPVLPPKRPPPVLVLLPKPVLLVPKPPGDKSEHRLSKWSADHEWNQLIDSGHTCTRRRIVGAEAAKAAALGVGAEAPEAAAKRHDVECSEESSDGERAWVGLANAHEPTADDCTVAQFDSDGGA